MKNFVVKLRVVEIYQMDVEAENEIDAEEVAIEEVINKQILVKYPVHKQLNIIATCLEAAGIPLTSEFTEMREYINQKSVNYNSALQTYKDNPSVYSFYPKPVAPEEE